MDKRHSKQLRVAVFGGAFDPPHLGHLQVIKEIFRLNLADEVWLMVNNLASWKNSSASPKDRLAMGQVLAKLVSPKVKVSDLEIKRGGVSYTLETVRELKKKFPEHEFLWVIGSDIMADVPAWENCQGLTEEIPFLVFPRTAVSSTEIREKVKKNEPITNLVPREIEQYIKESNLYR